MCVDVGECYVMSMTRSNFPTLSVRVGDMFGVLDVVLRLCERVGFWVICYGLTHVHWHQSSHVLALHTPAPVAGPVLTQHHQDK